jgi:hypothetical protein
VGRPTKYKPEFPAQAAKLCKLGATDKDLAEFFDVHSDSIAEWKKVHPEFSEALKAAKDDLDAQVERRLFDRAMGYSHQAVKMFFDGKTGAVVEHEYVERFPPDTTAAIFWLKNRKPDQWREAKAVEVTGKNGGPMQSQVIIATGVPIETFEDLA